MNCTKQIGGYDRYSNTKEKYGWKIKDETC